mmetsp:Transcript_39162/g.82367  ORF Transcript_39162/g.82367 Transcript_39162/m.82367 type:complete len:442 (-) Transcript_39162:703-2028(-)
MSSGRKLAFIFIGASFALLYLTQKFINRRILHRNASSDSLSPHRSLVSSYGLQGYRFFDPQLNNPQTVIFKSSDVAKDEAAAQNMLSPIRICERVPPIPHDIDILIHNKYASCRVSDRPPQNNTILLLEGIETFGRTGNNLIEFFHSLQYAKDNEAVVGIEWRSWPTHLLTPMWMAVQGEGNSGHKAFRTLVEKSFCVKFIDSDAEAAKYREVIRNNGRDSVRDLFIYNHEGPLNDYIEFQGHILRTLWRSYNTGIGFDMRHEPVGDMCSVIDATFGSEKSSAKYSVIHGRSLEGFAGVALMDQIARKSGCDPLAALKMEPEYVKAILKPLGMLDHPILFLTDHERPEIFERLQADPELRPNIQLAPEETSWVGGDITTALMSDVFIGNPASTFSGFIAKSRIALGYDENYLFRKKNDNGEWVDACEGRCIFDHNIVNAMA